MDSAVVYFAFGSTVVYILLGSLMWPWWSTPVGRSMVSLAAALGLALLPSTLHFAVGLDLLHPWFLWYYRVNLTLIGLIMLWRLVVLRRVQRAPRMKRREAP